MLDKKQLGQILIHAWTEHCMDPAQPNEPQALPFFEGPIHKALAAAGYAVVKTDPIHDQVIRALATVGWAVVPVEPTEAMKKHGADYLPVTPGGATNECAGRVYEAMIAAAQKDPA